MSPRMQRLRAEILSDLQAFAGRVEVLASLSRLSDAGPPTLAEAAVALHHAYGAVEAALTRIARAIDDGLPEGSDWHQALLHTMGLAIDKVRPAVLRPETRAFLQRLLGFRHFFRHAYALELDGTRLEDLRACAQTVLPLLSEDLRRFDDFLAEASQA